MEARWVTAEGRGVGTGDVNRERCVMFFFSSRRRHTRLQGDWSSDVCSSDLTRRLRFQILPLLTKGVLIDANGVHEEVRVRLLRVLPVIDRADVVLSGFGDCHEIGRASCRERV